MTIYPSGGHLIDIETLELSTLGQGDPRYDLYEPDVYTWLLGSLVTKMSDPIARPGATFRGDTARGALPRVAELWRYPVKSLLGERLPTLTLAADGVVGDRMWGIEDPGDGRILTGRREPRLLFAASRVGPNGLPVIALPEGQQLHGLGPDTDAALSAWLGKSVRLVSATESEAPRAEYFADPTDDTSEALEWTMPKGRFVDAFPVLVMTTAGLRHGASLYSAGSWDVRRFRPNVLIEHEGNGWVEDGWAGRRLRVGSAELVPRRRCMRCTMVNRAQPGLEKDVNIFKTLHRSHGGEAGMWTQVMQPGTLSEGDRVEME